MPVTHAELARRLHARGLRVTPQRAQVLAVVEELGHATPEQIRARTPGVDLTTVYRTLDLLEEIGLVRHTHLGHGAPSFRPAQDDHIHLVCHHCGAVIDVPDDLVGSLADRLVAERGFALDRAHFTVFGACRSCLADGRAPGAPAEQSAAAKR